MIIDANKYNLLRMALVDNRNDEHDIIEVRPKQFALKKIQDERVLEASMEILADKRITIGITPYDTMMTFEQDLTPEVALYVLMCYAVATQQGWITHSAIMDKYYVNQSHQDARQYVEDTHKTMFH
jgi:hypothetical protein